MRNLSGWAASALSEGAPSDARQSLVILKNLLADTNVAVQISAAVSLLGLDQDLARAPLLGWLERELVGPFA